MVVSAADMTIEETIERAARILIDVASPPAKVILFGSRARGDAEEDSDFDFLVIEKEVADRAAEGTKLRSALGGFGVPVDVIDAIRGSDRARNR